MYCKVNYIVNVEITGNITPLHIKLKYGRCTRVFGHHILLSIWQNIDLIKGVITCCKKLCCSGWINPTRTTDSHLERTISTNCCICTVVPRDDGPR